MHIEEQPNPAKAKALQLAIEVRRLSPEEVMLRLDAAMWEYVTGEGQYLTEQEVDLVYAHARYWTARNALQNKNPRLTEEELKQRAEELSGASIEDCSTDRCKELGLPIQRITYLWNRAFDLRSMALGFDFIKNEEEFINV
jgi:hypothetical protein